MTEAEARGWPDLMAVVESRVRPERTHLGDSGDAKRRKTNWWLWGRYTPGLFDAIEGLPRVLVCGQTSKYLSFVFLPNGMLLRAWGKPLTRHALNAGLIYMLNDKIRQGLLGITKRRGKAGSPRIVKGLDYVLQEMQKLGFVAIDNSRPQQVLVILPDAPSTKSAPKEDLVRIGEVKQVFVKQVEYGNVTENEDYIDAKQDLVSA
jgi:hypothetical protein